MVANTGWLEKEAGSCLHLVTLMLLHPQVREYVSKKVLPEEAPARKLLDRGGEGLLSSQHQWQFNLLTHVESLQDEVTHRMDSIEKELDGRAPSWAPCPWQALWASRKSCFLNPLIWLSRDSCVLASSVSPLISILPSRWPSLTFSIDQALLRAVCCQGSRLTLPVPSAQERALRSSWALPVGGVCPEQVFTDRVLWGADTWML